MLFGLKELNENAVVLNGNTVQPTSLFNESYDFTAMSYEMLEETEKSWTRLNKMVGEANCAMLHESITNPEGFGVFQENAFKNFYAKVKAFFVKLWGMIKEVFSKFVMWIDSKIKSEKEFVAKYETEIKTKMGVIKKVEVKGFEYTIDAVDTATTGIPTDAKAIVASVPEDADSAKMEEETKKKFVKAVLGGKGDEDDIPKSVFKALRNEADEKTDITIQAGDLNSLINELKTFSDTKSKMNKDKTASDKAFTNVISSIEKLGSAIGTEKADEKKKVDFAIQSLKLSMSLVNQANTAKVAALKERADFAKMVMVKVKSAANKDANMSENAGLFLGTI